jgi:hypothetical protein
MPRDTSRQREPIVYLTDREDTTLQVINKWIGGVKLNLVKTVDTDILRSIVIKLHQKEYRRKLRPY